MKPGRRSGFTLIEVLVASTMFVIVLTAVYATFRSVSDANTRSEMHGEVSQTARVVLTDVAQRLNGFYPLAIQLASTAAEESAAETTEQPALSLLGEDRQSGTSDSAELDSISFVTTFEDIPDGRRIIAGLARVSYYLKQDDTGRRLLLRESAPIVSIPQSTGGATGRGAAAAPAAIPPTLEPELTILSDQVTALNFQYFDKDLAEWVNEWSDAQRTPDAVLIQLAVQSNDRTQPVVEKFSQIVRLHPVTRYSKLPQSKAPQPTGSSGPTGRSGGQTGGGPGRGDRGGQDSGRGGGGAGGPGALPAPAPVGGFPGGGAGGPGAGMPGGGPGGGRGGGGFPGGAGGFGRGGGQ